MVTLRTLSVFLVATVAACAVVSAASDPAGTAKGVRSKGFKYIVASQNEDGSYGVLETARVGKTGLVLYILSSSQRAYRYTDGPFASKAIDYLLANQNEDGTFGDVNRPAWDTLTAVMALQVQADKEFDEAVAKGISAYTKATGEAFPESDAAFFAALKKALGDLGPMGALAEEISNRLAADDKSGTADWMTKTIDSLKKKQILADDTAPAYGSFPTEEGDLLEQDSVVVTALAGFVADRIKDNWKKVKDL